MKSPHKKSLKKRAAETPKEHKLTLASEVHKKSISSNEDLSILER